MRLIVDENISWRLKKQLPDWEILPVNEISPHERLSDLKIWLYARKHVYTVLTFDEDFTEIQNIHSYPPKIIWLRAGNITTKEIALLLIKYKSEIHSFLHNEELGIFEIYA